MLPVTVLDSRNMHLLNMRKKRSKDVSIQLVKQATANQCKKNVGSGRAYKLVYKPLSAIDRNLHVSGFAKAQKRVLYPPYLFRISLFHAQKASVFSIHYVSCSLFPFMHAVFKLLQKLNVALKDQLFAGAPFVSAVS